MLLETSTEYGRGLLRGIVRYSRLHGPWALYVAPGHLEQALPKAKSWGGTGIIARVRSPEMAKLIRGTGLPVVASFLDESHLSGRADKFGEICTNSAALGAWRQRTWWRKTCVILLSADFSAARGQCDGKKLSLNT
jgi:LacI family transcriptional regulator